MSALKKSRKKPSGRKGRPVKIPVDFDTAIEAFVPEVLEKKKYELERKKGK